jgi:hypothetical protein
VEHNRERERERKKKQKNNLFFTLFEKGKRFFFERGMMNAPLMMNAKKRVLHSWPEKTASFEISFSFTPRKNCSL